MLFSSPRAAAPAPARRWSSMTRLREGKAVLFLYAGLQPVERSEGARDLHESLEAALLDDVAVAQHHDQVSLSDGGQAVRDDERGTPCRQALETLHDEGLGLRVERRGGLVEDQDGGVSEDGARDGEALLFALRQREPLLSHHGVVSLGQ